MCNRACDQRMLVRRKISCCSMATISGSGPETLLVSLSSRDQGVNTPAKGPALTRLWVAVLCRCSEPTEIISHENRFWFKDSRSWWHRKNQGSVSGPTTLCLNDWLRAAACRVVTILVHRARSCECTRLTSSQDGCLRGLQMLRWVKAELGSMEPTPR